MINRQWVIPPSYLLGIVLVIFVYTTITEVADFFLRSYPISFESLLISWLAGWLLLWTFICSVTGWILVGIKRRPDKEAKSWPIVIVPLAIGILLCINQFYEFYQNGLLSSPNIPKLPIIESASRPLSVGILLSGFLWCQTWFWKGFSRPGLCYQCGYDLRGTVSNRCPECGLQIDDKGSTRPPISPKMFPEILLFETAQQRDAVCQAVTKQSWPTLVICIPLLIFVVTILVMEHIFDCFPEESDSISALYLFGPMICSFLPVGIIIIRRYRQLLRKKLLELGIPVCLKCGCDLRDIEGTNCPKCGTQLNL